MIMKKLFRFFWKDYFFALLTCWCPVITFMSSEHSSLSRPWFHSTYQNRLPIFFPFLHDFVFFMLFFIIPFPGRVTGGHPIYIVQWMCACSKWKRKKFQKLVEGNRSRDRNGRWGSGERWTRNRNVLLVKNLNEIGWCAGLGSVLAILPIADVFFNFYFLFSFIWCISIPGELTLMLLSLLFSTCVISDFDLEEREGLEQKVEAYSWLFCFCNLLLFSSSVLFSYERFSFLCFPYLFPRIFVSLFLVLLVFIWPTALHACICLHWLWCVLAIRLSFFFFPLCFAVFFCVFFLFFFSFSFLSCF